MSKMLQRIAESPLTAQVSIIARAAANVLMALVLAVVVYNQFELYRTKITPDNIESRVRVWLDNFRMSVKRLEHGDDTYFNLEATMRNGVPCRVTRRKSLDNYIMVGIDKIQPNPKQAKALQRLSDAQWIALKLQITQELARAKIAFEVGVKPLLVHVAHRLPITAELREHDLIRACNDIDYAQLGVSAIISSALLSQGLTTPTGELVN